MDELTVLFTFIHLKKLTSSQLCVRTTFDDISPLKEQKSFG